MKKLCFAAVFFVLIVFFAFGDTEEQEEIDYLLFLPNSSSLFVDEEQARVQLDNLAKYLIDKELIPGLVDVYGYAAFAANDIDPVHLSRNRALWVVNELQKRGVPYLLFSDAVGHGSVDLWGSNTNEEGRSPNRRVRVVLNGSVLVLEPSTGQVIESEVPLPAEPEAADSEILSLSTHFDEEPIMEEAVIRYDATDRPRKEFPWWILLPIFIFVLIPYIFAKDKKRVVYKTTKPRKAGSPPSASVAAAPITASPVVQPVEPSAPVPPPAPTVAPVPVSEKVAPPSPAPVEPAAPIVPPPAPAPTAAVVTEEIIVYLEEEIRRRAYEHYLLRNGQNGSMDADWYKALPEICAKYEADGYRTYKDYGCWWARKTFVIAKT
jgi:hypothetical protein